MKINTLKTLGISSMQDLVKAAALLLPDTNELDEPYQLKLQEDPATNEKWVELGPAE